MSEELASKILDLVGDRADAEVLTSEGISSLTRFANSFIHQNVGEHIEAVSLRVAVDGRVASGNPPRTPSPRHRFPSGDKKSPTPSTSTSSLAVT